MPAGGGPRVADPGPHPGRHRRGRDGPVRGLDLVVPPPNSNGLLPLLVAPRRGLGPGMAGGDPPAVRRPPAGDAVLGRTGLPRPLPGDRRPDLGRGRSTRAGRLGDLDVAGPGGVGPGGLATPPPGPEAVRRRGPARPEGPALANP